MSSLGNVIKTAAEHSVDLTPYLDYSDLDALRLVSKETNGAASLDALWSSFAKAEGCEFLHSRNDVKSHFAGLKEAVQTANDLFFPSNQPESITSEQRIENKEKYSTLSKAPKREELKELQIARENIDIAKIWRSIWGIEGDDNRKRHIRKEFDDRYLKKMCTPSGIAKYLFDYTQRELKDPNNYAYYLYLDKQKLTFLPPVLSESGIVKHLSLSKNEFRKFPDEIGRYQFLRTLDLSENKIESVPREVAQLEGLEVLNLRNNRIKEVPQEVLRMPNCKIHLDGNPVVQKRSGEELESSPKRQKPNME